MEESESDKICGFELRPDEAVRFYHRGQPEIYPLTKDGPSQSSSL